MIEAEFEGVPRTSDAPAAKARRGSAGEELRMVALLRLCELSEGEPHVEVSGAGLPAALEISREAAFAIVEYLSRKGFLDYHGAGPRVSLTPLGVRSLSAARVRRR